MQKRCVSDLLSLYLAPVLVMLLGLILTLNPDSLSVLISRILGWVLILIAIGCGGAAVFSSAGRTGKVICAITFAIAGGWLHANPLALASALGRFCGIFLMIDGLHDISVARRLDRRWLLPGLVTFTGFMLLLMPLSASRLLSILCGIVILIIGIVMLIDRLKHPYRLDPPEDRNIIDAL